MYVRLEAAHAQSSQPPGHGRRGGGGGSCARTSIRKRGRWQWQSGQGPRKRGCRPWPWSRPGSKGEARITKGECICCELPRVQNTKFCKDHKKSSEAMRYQASSSKDPDIQESCDALFKDEALLIEAVQKFTIENPPTAKYKRKSLIDWTQYSRKSGVK
eukprot:16436264-Heterocapsa_arctica.AAC.1